LEPASKLDVILGVGHRHACVIDFDALDKALDAAKELVTIAATFTMEAEAHSSQTALDNLLGIAKLVEPLRKHHKAAKTAGLSP